MWLVSQNFLQAFRIFFLQNGPYNINILVMFFELTVFLKFDQNGWFNRFDAVSAYMRKMDHYGLSDFLKISHIR